MWASKGTWGGRKGSGFWLGTLGAFRDMLVPRWSSCGNRDMPQRRQCGVLGKTLTQESLAPAGHPWEKYLTYLSLSSPADDKEDVTAI